jgi:hypothetical protein
VGMTVRKNNEIINSRRRSVRDRYGFCCRRKEISLLDELKSEMGWGKVKGQAGW